MNSDSIRQVCRMCQCISDDLKRCSRCKYAYVCSSEECREKFKTHSKTELCHTSVHDSNEELQRCQTILSRYLSKLFQHRIEKSVIAYTLRGGPHMEAVLCTINSGEGDICQNHRVARILKSVTEQGFTQKDQKSLTEKLNGSAMSFRAFIGSWDEIENSIEEDQNLGDINDVAKSVMLANFDLIKNKAIEKGPHFVTVYLGGGTIQLIEVFEYKEFISEDRTKEPLLLLSEK